MLRSKHLLYLYASLIIIFIVAGYHPITSWNLSPWFFNYHDGVLRRALIGTLINIDGDAVFSHFRGFIVTICLISILIFAYLLVYLTVKALSDDRDYDNPAYAYLIIAFALLGSGAIQQYAFDIGRFDLFGGLILAVGACLLITDKNAGQGNNTKLSLPVLTALSALAVLIHEGYVFWVFPFLASFWWLNSQKQTADVIKLAGATLFLLFLVVLVSIFSYKRVLSYEQAMQLLSSRTSNEMRHASLIVHYRGILENIFYSLGIVLTKKRALSSSVALLVLLPQLIIYYILLKQLWQRFFSMRDNAGRLYKFLDLSIYLMPLSPLMLSFFGHDQGRWFSMASLSFALASIVFVAKLGWHSIEKKTVIASLMLTSIVLGVTQGPFGVHLQMPLSWLRDIAFAEFMPGSNLKSKKFLTGTPDAPAP